MDPDADPDEDQALKYEWFCKKKYDKNEQIDFEKLENVGTVDYPDAPMIDRSDFNGCFGTGHGKLKEKGNIFTSMSWLQLLALSGLVRKKDTLFSLLCSLNF